MLEQEDIDGVIVATGERWHVLCSIHACQAGKDVYVEKPMALYVEEGRALVQAARKLGRRADRRAATRLTPATSRR